MRDAPQQLRHGETRITIGTSGYSYRDWVGPVYPAGTPAERFLELYAQRFSFVELNFSYYRMPEPQTLQSMVDRTPPEFRFAIKAHRSLTHTGGEPQRDSVRRYYAGVAPLRQAGRLAAVLLQFPYSFHYEIANRRTLAGLCEALGELPLFVEFRNDEWNHDAVYRELRRRGVGWVVPDLPGLPGLPPRIAVVTSQTGYLRLHGRNHANWWDGDSRSRYQYSYSDSELAELAPLLETIAEQSREVLVAFNNHADGRAAVDAERFGAILAARPLRPEA